MSLATLNPWQVLDQIQKEAFNQQAKRWHPAADITESETAYEVALDLPGIKPEDINIEIKEEKLYISGGREVEPKDATKIHYSERVNGRFNRAFRLPKDVNESAINAKFDYGVLRVEIPKAEKAQPRKIAIETVQS